MLGSKSSFNRFKSEIISNIFSNHNGIKLEINHKKKTKKHTNTWRLNYVLNNEWDNNEIRKKPKDTLRQIKIKAR